jgi:hypothetical protein
MVHQIFGEYIVGKVTKEVSEMTIEFADNGFVVRYSGRDDDDDWSDTKIIVNDIDTLCDKVIKDVVKLKA